MGAAVRSPLLVEEGDLGAHVQTGALGLQLVHVIYGADVVRSGRPGDQQPGRQPEIPQRPCHRDGVLDVLALRDPGREQHERPAVVEPQLPHEIDGGALENKGTDEFAAKQREVALLLDQGSIDMGEAQLRIEHFWAGALRRAVIDGDVENGSVMAGQSVGMVKAEEPAAQIIQTLLAECEAALAGR